MNDKYEKIREILVRQLGVDKKLITPEASFVDDLGADSIDSVELIVEIENEFGVDIDEETASSLKKVGDLIKFIESRS